MVLCPIAQGMYLSMSHQIYVKEQVDKNKPIEIEMKTFKSSSEFEKKNKKKI